MKKWSALLGGKSPLEYVNEWDAQDEYWNYQYSTADNRADLRGRLVRLLGGGETAFCLYEDSDVLDMFVDRLYRLIREDARSEADRKEEREEDRIGEVDLVIDEEEEA